MKCFIAFTTLAVFLVIAEASPPLSGLSHGYGYDYGYHSGAVKPYYEKSYVSPASLLKTAAYAPAAHYGKLYNSHDAIYTPSYDYDHHYSPIVSKYAVPKSSLYAHHVIPASHKLYDHHEW